MNIPSLMVSVSLHRVMRVADCTGDNEASLPTDVRRGQGVDNVSSARRDVALNS